MNDPAIENEVIRRWQEQTPMRRIAAELRISRYRVKRIILDHQTGRARGDDASRSADAAGVAGQHPGPAHSLHSGSPGALAFDDGAADSRGVAWPGFHGQVHDREGPGASAAAGTAPPAGAAIRDRPRGSKHKWIMPPTRSTSPRKGGGGSTCSVTSWATRGGSTCTSPSRRTSRRRSASTCGPSSTWAVLPPPACTTT